MDYQTYVKYDDDIGHHVWGSDWHDYYVHYGSPVYARTRVDNGGEIGWHCHVVHFETRNCDHTPRCDDDPHVIGDSCWTLRHVNDTGLLSAAEAMDLWWIRNLIE